MCANFCVFTNNPNENATRFAAVALIVLSTIYAMSISDKIKFTEAATVGVLYKKLFLKILTTIRKKLRQ